MIDYQVTFERTTGFWIFKKTEYFFYRILSNRFDRYGVRGDKYALATVYYESYNAPRLTSKEYQTDVGGATEMDAINGLIELIANETNSVCVLSKPTSW
jgi:hypothetical protein